jgi:hypothetical protein
MLADRGESPFIGEGIPGPDRVKVSPEFGSVAVTVNLMVSGPQKDLVESGAVATGGEFMVIVQEAVS